MEQSAMFDLPEVEVTKASRRRMNAVKWLMQKGYRPTIGGLSNLKNFELCNIDTGEVEHFDIDEVLADYDRDRKDEARARAAEKRMQKKGVQQWHH